MSIQAYQRTATQAEQPRDLEYRAFGVVTASLLRARDSGPADVAMRYAAIQENRRLWTELSIDCSLPGNRLPDALKAQIISLALFVDRYSSQVMRENAEIDPLIDINRSVMEGLSAR